MEKQITFAQMNDELAQARTSKKEFLEKIERIIPWGKWIEIIRPCYYKGERGNKPYPLELMVRVFVLQNLYDLADMKVMYEVSLKRGGILLIQIAVGSMYMFSVPRGFSDGFIMWIKQVIATCLTTFLQSTMLVCGLILFKEHWLLGLGVMLSAGEIPRIAGMFGLETSVRPNIAGAINTAQSAVRLTQTVKTIVTK